MHGRVLSLSQASLVSVVLAASVLLSPQTLSADSFNWQSVNGQNWNSGIESQFGGTCWDFSSCGNLDAKYRLTRNDPNFAPQVSEQQIDWETNPDMGSTGGGSGQSVLNYFTTHGVVSGTECPYQSSSADTGIAPYWPLANGWQNRVWKSTSNWDGCTGGVSPATTATMKAYLKLYGPLEVGCQGDVDTGTGDLFDSLAAVEGYTGGTTSAMDHEVSLVGYVDDPNMANHCGGYWIIKNSWGSLDTNGWNEGVNGTGYYYIPYNNIEVHNDISAITGAVYYTGPMYHTGAWDGTGVDYTGTAATNTWKGTTSGVWDTTSGSSGNWANNSTGQAFTWVNQELQAIFDNSGNNRAITINGTIIAHGLTFNAGGTGYSFGGGSLTVTSGGIQANESVTFNSAMYIGGPQAWTVAGGKTLTVNGALHTIISDLTFNGAGNTLITGTIDGGGVMNTVGGAAPGGLIQTGAGTVTLSGAGNFAGNLTVNGAGPLNLAPAGGSASYTGGLFGGGTINVAAGVVSLGGGASNFSGTLNVLSACTLQFVPPAGVVNSFNSLISGGGAVAQNGAGATILSAMNNYSGATIVSNGALQANFGVGIPATSFLALDGGVLQSNGSNTVNFTRGLGTSGATFQWTANGGGFSAGGGPMVVNIGGHATPDTLAWGVAPADVGTKIVGTLKFGSTSATAATTFQNSIALGGVDRTIQVDDNPNSGSDFAEITGSISGSGGIVKNGAGVLKLSGANGYTGNVTINGGVLQAGINGGTGIPTNNFLTLNGGVLQVLDASSFTRSLGGSGTTFQWGLGGGGFSAAANPLTINVGGQATPSTLVWGSSAGDVGTKLIGPLLLNLSTAGNSLTLQNGIDLAGGARAIVAGGNTVYLNAAISDSVGGASFTKSGPGVLCIAGSAPNTYTGATTLSGGDVYLNKSSLSGYAIPGNLVLTGTTQMYVSLQGDNQIVPSSQWTFNGTGGWQELQLCGHSQTVTGLACSSGQGAVENSNGGSGYGAVTLSINAAAGNSFGFNGALRDTATGSCGGLWLVKSGAGTQTLSGGNISYSGSTTISGGTLALQDVSSFASAAISDNATLELDAINSSVTMSNPIGGSGSLNIKGSNQLTLSGNSGNSYTGATTISAGTVTLAKTAGYAIPGSCTISGGSTCVIVGKANPQFSPNSTLTFSSSPRLEVCGNNVIVAGISGAGIIENTETQTGVGGGTLTVNVPAGSANSYSGYLRDTSAAGSGSGVLTLVKDGAGSLTLSGSNVGGYTGGLFVDNGTLDCSTSGTALPNCNYTIGGVLKIASNKSQSIKAFQMTGGSVSGGSLTASSAYDLEAGTVSVTLLGSVGLTKTTPGSVTFTKTPPNGPYTISAGMLVLGTLSKTMSGGSLTMTGGTLSGSGTLTAASGYNYNIQAGTVNMVLGGTASSIGLLKSGTGTALLLAMNKYGGTTTINGGTLQLGSGSSNAAAGSLTNITINSGGTLQLGDGGTGGSISSGTVTVNPGGIFDVNHSDALIFGTGYKFAGSGTLAKDGSGTLTMPAASTFAGSLMVDNGLFDYSGCTATFPSGSFTINGGTLALGTLTRTMGSGSLLTLAGGTLSGSGTLTGTSTYQLQAGTVNIGLGGSVGVNKTGTGTATLLKNLPGGNYAISAGTLNLGGFSQSISGLSITGGTLTGNGTLTSSSDYDVQGGVVDVVLGGSSVGVHKSGPATAILTRANTFGGSTTISGGALQADFGASIPASGFLTLDGGVLETLSGGTFTRSLGNGESNSFQMTANGGGFSTVGGPCVVNIGGNGDSVPWGDDVGSGLVGTLKLCSPTCTNTVTVVNPINLCGGARTIEVDANPNSTAGYAVLAGAISDSYGNGALLKTGDGTLYISGADSNSYGGTTTIMGSVVLAKSGGAIAIPADTLILSETGDGTNTILQLNGDNEIDPSAKLTFSTSLAAARLELNGHAQTVAGLSGNSHAAIEGLFDNSGLNSDSTLTVNNAADCSFAGVIRDSAQGSGTGKLNLIKSGAGNLLLSGTASYTGATTINGGMLQVTGSTFASSGVSIGPAGALYFNRTAGYLGYANPITGSGLLQINQGAHALYVGTGANMALGGFAGTVSLLSGGVYLQSAAALGSSAISLGNGAICDLLTSSTTTFANPVTLNGIGGTLNLVTRPALYGDGSGAAYTLTGPITLAASSDVGNSENNAPLTLSGQITGPGGLVIGKPGSVTVTQYGGVTLAGTASNNYSGGTTINRGTLYLQKSGGAIAIPGNLSISPSDTSAQGNTYLILNGSDQIAPSATLTFTPVRAMHAYFELLGNQQTLAGIADGSGRGIIENCEQQSGVASNGTLTINNTANCSYGGYIRNGDLAANAASTGLLALVKSGPGTLTLLGGNCSAYTGGLTVNAGTLDYSGAGALPGTPTAYPSGPTGPTSPAVITPCPYTINGGTLNIGWLSASIGPLQITGGTLTGTGTLASNAAYDVRGGRVDAALAGGSSIGLTKSGPATAVLTGGNSYAGRTTVAGGTLELSSAAESCVLSVGGADLQSGALVFDYAGGADPAATIAGMLKASCDNGHWDLGQFQDSTAALTGLTLGMVDNTTSHQVTVMATYPGDFNLDGVVNGQDCAIWAANVFTGSSWQQGDANGDGAVNGLDRDLWYSHENLPPLAAATPAGITPAPEPGMLALLAAGLMSLLAFAWRKPR